MKASKKSSAKSAAKSARKLLTPEQRSAIAQKAAFAAHKTMQSKAYKNAAKRGRRAVEKYLDSRA